MDIKDKITEISKKIGEGVSGTYKNVADKSGKFISETKMKMKISERESEIEESFFEMGKRIYKLSKEDSEEFKEIKNLDKEFSKKCKEISKKYNEINEIEKNILYNKGLRKCENCGEIIENESNYCIKCGEKQNKVKLKKLKEENETKKEIEEPIEKVCPTCGTVMDNDVNFCKKCGFKF